MERIPAYLGYAIRDYYAFEASATMERIPAYLGYTIRDYYTSEVSTFIKRIITYLRYRQAIVCRRYKKLGICTRAYTCHNISCAFIVKLVFQAV